MSKSTLTTSNLSFGYSDSPVLQNLDITFTPGTFHAIVGPNGSGKTTLLDLLSNHRPPSHGEILLEGKPISSIDPMKLARKMALVEQETNFNFPFTVFDAVMMGRHPHIQRFARPSDQDMEAVRKSIEEMDLTHLSNRTISELSGGERQRTVFARALAQDTTWLLLDEPTSSMDIRHALAAMNLLRRLAHEENRTIIAVLHDLNLATTYCDQVTVLHGGTLNATGKPCDILTPETINKVFGVKASVHENKEGSPLIIYESKE